MKLENLLHIKTMTASITKVFAVATLMASMLLPFSTQASTILATSFQDVVQNSEFIFEGQVLSQQTRRSLLDGTPFTYSTFRVIDVIKGEAPAGGLITLGFAGGTINGMTLEVHDLQMPELNERGIYFVESMDKELVNPFYGWQQGHYLVIKDAVMRVDEVTSTTQGSKVQTAAPTVSNFKNAIRSQLGGAQ